MHTNTKTTQNFQKQCDVHKTINQQHKKRRIITDSILSYRGWGGGLKYIYVAANIFLQQEGY